MAQLMYSPGTPGNLFSNVTLVAGANAAVLVDCAVDVAAKVTVRMTTDGTAPTGGTTFACFAVAGSGTAGATTLSAGASAGATSLGVVSATVAGLIGRGEKIALIPAAGGPGEIVTVSSVSGTTLTLGAATENAYTAGDRVFLIEQSSGVNSLAPGSAWSANSTYGGSIQPTAGWLYILQALNGDAAQPVTVTATLDLDSAFG